MTRLFFICGVFMFSFFLIQAQSLVKPKTGGYWLSYMGDNKINEHIGLHTEAQLRNIFIDESVETKVFRVGLNYYFQPNAILTAGYAFIANFPNEDYLDASRIIENRIWQQVLVRHKSRVLFMEHRYRLEQRFLNNQTNGTYNIDNRFRYRFQAIFPFYTLSPKLRHVFLIANNEIMINFKKDPSLLFDRNRLSAGLGYQISPKFNLQFTYLNQYAQVPNIPTARVEHYFVLGINYNMDDLMPTLFKKKKASSKKG